MRTLPTLALAVALGLAAPAAVARDITTAEGIALEQTIAEFIAATRAADSNGVLAVMPPAILEDIARDNGMSVEQLRATVAAQIATMAEDMADDEFAMDMAGAEHRELADGTPYLVIPTTTVLNMDGTTATAHTPTLAFMGEGTWYLVRIADEAQIAMLTNAYPQFGGVAFPEARMETQSP